MGSFSAFTTKVVVISFLFCGTIFGQVAAGGGGEPRPNQFFQPAPELTSSFYPSGRHLTALQRHQRDETWRAEIRKQLYVPAKLPSLNAQVHSTFSPCRAYLPIA